MALLELSAFDDVLPALESFSNLFVMTRSDKGSVIALGNDVIEQAAIKVRKVIDTTGAGDAYTAAFLTASPPSVTRRMRALGYLVRHRRSFNRWAHASKPMYWTSIQ